LTAEWILPVFLSFPPTFSPTSTHIAGIQ
jgi:hypothetical protein